MRDDDDFNEGLKGVLALLIVVPLLILAVCVMATHGHGFIVQPPHQY